MFTWIFSHPSLERSAASPKYGSPAVGMQFLNGSWRWIQISPPATAGILLMLQVSGYLLKITKMAQAVRLAGVGRQYFTLENDGSGSYSISFKYSSPWEAGAPPAQRIYLNISLPEEISLASPEIISFAALSAPAPEELSLLQSEPEMNLLGSLPANFDWRDSGNVPPVRNQGSCGSCYAFATVGAMEAAMRINGITADLSEQFLVSCTRKEDGYINSGCSGGRPDSHKFHLGSLAKAQSTAGAVFESSMPYTASDSACYAVDHPYQLTSWHTVAPTWNTIPDAETIKNIIYTKGPVAASLCSLSAFNAYRSGIFTTNETCSGATNHAINPRRMDH